MVSFTFSVEHLQVPDLAKMKIADSTPFDDSTDFEDFDYNEYYHVCQFKYDAANLDTPLNIYKFMICKMYNISGSQNFPESKNDQEDIDSLSVIEEVEDIYKEFLAKHIPMTARERGFVRSAYGAVQLVKIAFKSKMDELDFEVFDFDKFKEICSDILSGCIGELFTGCFKLIFYEALSANCFEFSNFLLGMISEINVRTKELRKGFDEEGITPENRAFFSRMLYLKNELNQMKAWYMVRMLGFYHNQKMLGSIEESQVPAFDSVKGRMLLDFLKFRVVFINNEFFKIPPKIENFSDAEKVFKSILKMSEKPSCDCCAVKDANEYVLLEGLAYGYFAGFYENQSNNVTKFSQQSINILEKVEEAEIADDLHAETKKE